jgi:spore maturation protein CgeB
MTSSPPATLQRNLDALAEVQPQLHQRLCWPVEGDHFARSEPHGWRYRWRGGWFDAGLSQDEAAELVAHGLGSHPAEGLLLGIGAGELVAAALASSTTTAWTAWDRDPWLVRTALSSHDWSAELRSGRLRLALGSDLLDLDRSVELRIEHPLLARVYADELLLLQAGAEGRRALVCTGELFVDSLSDALRSQGYAVYPFEARRQSLEELAHCASRVAPDLVASINFLPGLPEFCEQRELEYVCWEVDPALDVPRISGPSQHAHIFTYRRENVAAFSHAGFSHVEYLGLAADPKRRQPRSSTGDEAEVYASPISFVGMSLVENAERLRGLFLQLFSSWQPQDPGAAEELLTRVVEGQRRDFASFHVPELLDAAAPGWRAACLSAGRPDPALLVGELCAAEKRLNYVADLAHHGLDVWGDEGWRLTEAHGARYRGPAKHEADLPRIYAASTINLDIGRIYQSDIVTMRIFDICACGGFVLAERSKELARLFELGVELESYATFDELREKVAYYLAHPEEARHVAQRGREAVLERHRIDQRVAHMLRTLPRSRAS